MSFKELSNVHNSIVKITAIYTYIKFFHQNSPIHIFGFHNSKTFRISIVDLDVDIVRVDPQAFQKNQKRHFFRDIQKSFQEVTPIGPEPHQFFSF